MERNDKIRLGIYGANIIVPSVIRGTFGLLPVKTRPFLESIADSANPYAAIGFGLLNLAGRLSPEIRNSLFTRTVNLAGMTIYGLQTLGGLASIIQGDYSSLPDLAFDFSIAYQTGRDTFEGYSKNKLVDDWNAINKNARKLYDKTSLRIKSRKKAAASP